MMSILPNESTAFLTSSSAAPGLVRSPAKTAVSPSISPEACSATSPSRSLIRTWAPCATSSSAVARPIPRAEPVTIAVLPSSTPIAVASPCLVGEARLYGVECPCSAASRTSEGRTRRSARAGKQRVDLAGGGAVHRDRHGHAKTSVMVAQEGSRPPVEVQGQREPFPTGRKLPTDHAHAYRHAMAVGPVSRQHAERGPNRDRTGAALARRGASQRHAHHACASCVEMAAEEI